MRGMEYKNKTIYSLLSGLKLAGVDALLFSGVQCTTALHAGVLNWVYLCSVM